MARSTLAERFATSSHRPAKTFVIEAHADHYEGPQAYLEAVVAETAVVRPTSDTYLFKVQTDDLELWIDALDPRFWSFHSWSSASEARRYLKDRVERRRDLDFTWLPSQHLRQVWPGIDVGWLRSDFRGERFLPPTVEARGMRVQVRGRDSQELVEYLAASSHYQASVAFDKVGFQVSDPHFGFASEAVDRFGQFAAVGDSFELHQEIVRNVVARYSNLVRLVEARSLTAEPLPPGGFRPTGSPLLLTFSRGIPDMETFLDGLFTAREPFRLWGVPQATHDAVWTVDAVDLHVGRRLLIDVAQNWMRVYLPEGACGNSVVRLVANLQHSFDANVHFADPALEAALRLEDHTRTTS